LLDEAWRLARNSHGYGLTVHTPGMFVVDGKRGRFRAVSITGAQCELDCEHCKGALLKSMPHVPTPGTLMAFGKRAAARADHGLLITGGCDSAGRLPWREFLPVIRSLKESTSLLITVHAGQTDAETARALKDAGVDQALVDVIGDDDTARHVYHLPEGVKTIRRTLDALAAADLAISPHIVFGLHYGVEKGEKAALEILKDYPLKKYVVVALTPSSGTPMAAVSPPAAEDVAAFIARARLQLPHLEASLGCARPRGAYRRRLDVLAVRAGVNSLALPADSALDEATTRGLRITRMETCCSLSAAGNCCDNSLSDVSSALP
jgi:hypothetical protein